MRLGIPDRHARACPWFYGYAAAFVLSLFIFSAPATAQQAGQSSFDVRQLERRFETQESTQGPGGRPGVAVPRVARPDIQADATPFFVLRNVLLTGAHAIPPDRLAAAWQPFLGKKVSQADLATIAGGIGDVYRAAGFHLSRAIVPPQDIQDGTVRVRIIEGTISDVELKGEGAEQFGIRAMLAPMMLSDQPSRLSTLERQLVLINARPGVRITDSQIEEIGNVSGRFRLVISVQTWHIYAYVGLDNLGSSSVGPWQSYATAAYNSLITPGDTLAVNLSTTPGDVRQLRFGRISWEAPIGIDGVRVGASGLYSEVWPGDIRREFSDNTKTEAFELRASFAALQTQRSTLTLTVATAFSNVSEQDTFGPIYRDRIRTFSLNGDYKLQDNFGGTNYLTVNWRQGLDILGAAPTNDFTSVLDASPKFSALNFWFTRYQTINDSFSLKFASAGQVASGPMFLSQQFYLGGLAFGRGYGAAEISGDNGIAGSLELRFDQKLSYKYLTGYQFYGFVDSGLAWNDGFRPADGIALTSAGGGVRFFLGGDLQADLGVAVPLGYRAPDNWSRHPRFLFTLSNAFRLCPERAATRCL
jgi:hemolysin activation/secretion protein